RRDDLSISLRPYPCIQAEVCRTFLDSPTVSNRLDRGPSISRCGSVLRECTAHRRRAFILPIQFFSLEDKYLLASRLTSSFSSFDISCRIVIASGVLNTPSNTPRV